MLLVVSFIYKFLLGLKIKVQLSLEQGWIPWFRQGFRLVNCIFDRSTICCSTAFTGTEGDIENNSTRPLQYSNPALRYFLTSGRSNLIPFNLLKNGQFISFLQ